MLHDPEMEVTCDGEGCTENVFLRLDWFVSGYDLTDSDAARILARDHGWAVEGKYHYCGCCKQALIEIEI